MLSIYSDKNFAMCGQRFQKGQIYLITGINDLFIYLLAIICPIMAFINTHIRTYRGRRGRDLMVVGLTTTISNHCISPLTL